MRNAKISSGRPLLRPSHEILPVKRTTNCGTTTISLSIGECDIGWLAFSDGRFGLLRYRDLLRRYRYCRRITLHDLLRFRNVVASKCRALHFACVAAIADAAVISRLNGAVRAQPR